MWQGGSVGAARLGWGGGGCCGKWGSLFIREGEHRVFRKDGPVVGVSGHDEVEEQVGGAIPARRVPKKGEKKEKRNPGWEKGRKKERK